MHPSRVLPILLLVSLACPIPGFARPPRAAQARVPDPRSVLVSHDGRFIAANWHMKQEGMGAFLLFDRGELVRLVTGGIAVGFERGTMRLLVDESVPDDETEFYFLDLGRADDSEYGDLPRIHVHRSTGWTLESWDAGRIVFRSAYDPSQRDTVETAKLR